MAALGQQQYDILIIDVIMPEEDGFQFAKKLVKVYPGLPFLFITARKMKEDVMKGLSPGADDYIIKPFDADEPILRLKTF
jgi:DNA-binding response OmpR family regulator